MPERIVDRVRMRLEEVRTRGVIPAVRTRVEEIVTQVKERVSGQGASGGILTRESGSVGSGGEKPRRMVRGL
ncbi:MAG: hypothetical protein ACTSPB_15655 [Candidatus Thorarchaeota archaeon]